MITLQTYFLFLNAILNIKQSNDSTIPMLDKVLKTMVIGRKMLVIISGSLKPSLGMPSETSEECFVMETETVRHTCPNCSNTFIWLVREWEILLKNLPDFNNWSRCYRAWISTFVCKMNITKLRVILHVPDHVTISKSVLENWETVDLSYSITVKAHCSLWNELMREQVKTRLAQWT